MSLRSELEHTGRKRVRESLLYFEDLYRQSRASCMGDINVIAEMRNALQGGKGIPPKGIDWLFSGLVSTSTTVTEGCKDLLVIVHGKNPEYVEKKLVEVFGMNGVGPENWRILGKLTKECLSIEIMLRKNGALGRILENMHKLCEEDRKWAAGRIASIASNGIDAKAVASIKAGLAQSARFCPGGRVQLQDEFRGYWKMVERVRRIAKGRGNGMQEWKPKKRKEATLHRPGRLTQPC